MSPERQPRASSRGSETPGATDPIELPELFLSSLGTIRNIVRATGHKFGFDPWETQDLLSAVYLKLVDRNYAVIRNYRKDSSWATYLTSLVRNQARSYLVARDGRWRPSRIAERLGDEAQELERLRFRDGLSVEEAIQMIYYRSSNRRTRAEIRVLAEQLPQRIRRRRVALDDAPQALRDSPNDPLQSLEAREAGPRVERVLELALAVLGPDELSLLQSHFGEGRRLTEIARSKAMPQRKVYTIRDRALRKLRRAFEGEGIGAGEAKNLLAQLEKVGSLELDCLGPKFVSSPQRATAQHPDD